MLKYKLFACVILIVAVLSSVATAFAAPVGWSSVDVTVHSEQSGGTTMLVAGKLPASTALPADVELSLPAGAQVQWAGEILGGPVDKDPSVTYTKATVSGQDVYKFRLTKARTGQIEAAVPGLVTSNGAGYAAALKWTPTQDVPEVKLNVRLPTTAKIDQQVEGATLVPSDAANSYYAKSFKNVKTGQPLDLSFAYTLSAAAPISAGSASGSSANSDNTIVWVLVALAAGGFGFMASDVRRKLAAKKESAEVMPEPARTSAAKKEGTKTRSTAKRHAEAKTEPAPPVKRTNPRNIVFAAVAVLFIGGFSIAFANASAPKIAEGRITKSFNAPNTCQGATIPLVPKQGVDLSDRGLDLLKVFEGMAGIGVVTLDPAASTIDVAWCESSQNKQAILDALAGSGLVTVSQQASAASAPASATLDPTGAKQTISVDAATGDFSPKQVMLKAGVPTEVAFSQGSGCLNEVVISDLGVRQDLSKGGAKVQLPALQPGTYTFACGLGHQEGRIVVQ